MDEILALYNHESFTWTMFWVIFVMYGIVDGLYTRWMYLVTEKNALAASTAGAFLALFICIGVKSYTVNALYIVPVVVGSFFGTYIEVTREKRKLAKENK